LNRLSHLRGSGVDRVELKGCGGLAARWAKALDTGGDIRPDSVTISFKSAASGNTMNLNQVTLPATNVERSAEFYRRLGFTQIVSALPRYARFECQDGATFSLHAFDTVIPSQTVVYFECDDLDATYKRLLAQGIEFNQAPKDQIWLWREAYLQDPDGNILCLYHAGGTRRFPPWRLSDDSPRV
jgi:predicted enzyme related to lactoylglutathione lyase